jgi:hypothetical protein
MRMQSRLPASRAALIVPRNLPQITAYLVKRVSIPAQLILPLASDCAVVRVGQQQLQAWWEHLWPNPLTQERLHLHAFVCKEHTVTLHALINLACAALIMLRYLPRSSQQGEATLCQR